MPRDDQTVVIADGKIQWVGPATDAKVPPNARLLDLKDYTVHHAPEGFRLARCAAGDGVIDFPAISDVIRSARFPVLLRWLISAITGYSARADQVNPI